MEERRGAKRSRSQSVSSVQEGNRAWWAERPMAYSWRGEVDLPKFSPGWFDAIDDRFLHESRLYSTEIEPFDRVIPFEQIEGRQVLEIGCGMGLHTELMAKSGAKVTAIDLTDTAVEATRRRLDWKGLSADVMQVDAERLPFDDGFFDFVWSWGVIHHTARTARIVRHIARVLRPDGECRVMVYNRESTLARVHLMRNHFLTRAFLGGGTFDETLYRSTDGFSARFYVPEHFEDLFRAFFEDIEWRLCGQEVDALPVPQGLRRRVAALIPDQLLRSRVEKCGSFLFLTARQPC